MEIFIVGAIVVALMAYASTRIKRSAAEAFEREEIKTDEFYIVKPTGFLHPFKEDSPFAFEAYTKDFGDGEAKSFRESRATLRVYSDSDFKTVRRDAEKTADKIASKNSVENADANQKVFLMETEKLENKVKINTFWKIIENRANGKIYEFQISVLEGLKEKYADAIREMRESFKVN